MGSEKLTFFSLNSKQESLDSLEEYLSLDENNKKILAQIKALVGGINPNEIKSYTRIITELSKFLNEKDPKLILYVIKTITKLVVEMTACVSNGISSKKHKPTDIKRAIEAVENLLLEPAILENHTCKGAIKQSLQTLKFIFNKINSMDQDTFTHAESKTKDILHPHDFSFNQKDHKENQHLFQTIFLI